MWTGIKQALDHAIDGNTEAINHIAAALRRTKESQSAAAVLTAKELRLVLTRAEQIDYDLRAVVLAIQDEVKTEQEAHP